MMRFIRNNLFWVVLGLAVLAIAGLHVFVARATARHVEGLERQSKDNIDKLRKLVGQETPNQAGVDAAETEREKIKRLRGGLHALFALRSGLLDGDFIRKLDQPDVKFLVADAQQWWDEYENRKAAFQAATADHFTMSKGGTFTFATRPSTVSADVDQVKDLQRKFWILKSVVDALAEASPPSKDPVIRQLLSVRIVPDERPRRERATPHPSAKTKHPWLRAILVDIDVVLDYQRLPGFIAALHNAFHPVVVTQYVVTRRDAAAKRASGPAAAEFGAPPAMDDADAGKPVLVSLRCELIEFRCAVHAVTFPNMPFTDGTKVSKWLAEQAAELGEATRALAKHSGAFQERIEQAVRVDMLPGHWERIRRIKAEAPGALRDKLDAAAREGRVTADKKAEIEAKHDKAVEGQIASAKSELKAEVAKAAAASNRFDLAYDYLRPLVRQKVYLFPRHPGKPRHLTKPSASVKEPNPCYLIVRAPEGRKNGGGRWWLLSSKSSGTRWRTRRKVAEYEEDENKLRLLVNTKAASKSEAQVVQAELTLKDGRSQTYYAVEISRRSPLSLSDTVFRFAPAIIGAAAKAGTGAVPKRLVIVRADLMTSTTGFEAPVVKGGKEIGKIKVDLGLRK